MKFDFQSHTGEKSKMLWFTWSEDCDCCGKRIRTSGNWDTNKEADLGQEDLCLECLYFAMDHHIKGPRPLAEKIKKAMATEKAKVAFERTESKT